MTVSSCADKRHVENGRTISNTDGFHRMTEVDSEMNVPTDKHYVSMLALTKHLPNIAMTTSSLSISMDPLDIK